MAASPTYSVKGQTLPECPGCHKAFEANSEGRCSLCGYEPAPGKRLRFQLVEELGLLDDVRQFVRRFVVLNDEQLTAVTLWIAHTHAIDAFSVTPYLAISSPEKRSGKTRLLEVMELLVRDPLPTANISDAALFRVVDAKAPTLLIDEVDAIFGPKSDRNELRGILNAGYRRGAVTHRMGGTNNTQLQSFSVFCAKAFAGIGDSLPDTITDRAIAIRLKRRTRDEHVEKFRRREVEAEGFALHDRLATWLERNVDHLAAARPDLPDELDDRAQDVWEPLLAIGDLVEVDGRPAAVILSSGDERSEESLTATLIADIAAVFDDTGHDRLKTADLLDGLYRIEESPWGDYYGKQLSPQSLSRLLRPYRIRTMPVRVDGVVVKGYKREQFEDAFARVSGFQGVTRVTTAPLSQKQDISKGLHEDECNPLESGSNPHEHRDVTPVTPSNAKKAPEAVDPRLWGID